MGSGIQMTKILIVDDDPIILNIIHRMLKENGYWPISAISIRGALKMLDEEPAIELVISDIEMPKGNAFDLLRQFAQSPRFQTLPVILCSSKGDKETLIKSLRAGARDFIVKPFTARTLISKVKKALDNGKPKVLIIEHVKDIRHRLQKIIEYAGFTVMTAENIDLGMLELTKSKIDIVIANIDLNEAPGKSLVEKISNSSANTQVLLISDNPGDANRETSLPPGIVGFIGKPLKKDEIAEQLRSILKAVPA